MRAVLFLPMIHSSLDQPDFHEKIRTAIVDAFGHCDARFASDRAKLFPVRFQYRSDPQFKLLVEGEIITSGYMKDFCQWGIAVAIQKELRKRGLCEALPNCELCLSITMKVTLVL